MKNLTFVLTLIFVFSVNAFGQTDSKKKPPKGYDAKLAKKLGADQYGMKTYVFVMLKRGTATFDTEKRKSLIEGHLKNIGRLAEAKKLVLAGPFADDQEWRGIYIFDVKTVEEAQKLVETDPAIKAGVFEVEMHPWYGSASLLEVMRIHKKLQKEEI